MLRTATWRTLAVGRVGRGCPLTVCSAGEPKAEWLALKLPSRELAGKRKHAFDDAQVLMWEVSHEGETVVSHSVSPSRTSMAAWFVSAVSWWRLCSFSQHWDSDLCETRSPAPLLRPTTPHNLVAPTFLSFHHVCFATFTTLHHSRLALHTSGKTCSFKMVGWKNCRRM